MGADQIDEIAEGLAGADLVGFSSMTGYSDLTRKVINRLREVDPKTFIIWGGIHPIIHPEDAILADVDAICTGEGEFAFEELYTLMNEGRDYTGVENFWFKQGGKIIRNGFRPLMNQNEMEGLPFPQYGSERERIYKDGRGFVPMKLHDYLANDGLGYSTLWSIGCPFHCAFCGNTKFIANDASYKKLRHPSARYIVDEIKAVQKRFPHVSQVTFHDDSFMAITYRELETFAEIWKEELGIPFAVYGVIPNYVKQDKFDLLTWAGMNRVRMGIQSGSEQILEFYKRPTPLDRILSAGEVIASFAPKYHIPPAYDIITDNPVETRQDVVDTLELLYTMPRPYTLNIFALKVIPNTGLEQALKDQGHRPRRDLRQLLPHPGQGRQPHAVRDDLLAATPLALRPAPAPGGGNHHPPAGVPVAGIAPAGHVPGQTGPRPPQVPRLLDHPRLVGLHRLACRTGQVPVAPAHPSPAAARAQGPGPRLDPGQGRRGAAPPVITPITPSIRETG